MMDFVDKFNKEMNKIEGIASESEPPRYWFSTGNYMFNYIMSGDFYKGIPQGRITAFAGPSSSGKSFVQCNVQREAQKAGAYVLNIDTENALDDSFVEKIGISTDKSQYNYKSVITIDNTIKMVSSFVKMYKSSYGTDPDAPKVLIVIDSLDMLLTSTELKNFEKGDNSGDQGQRAKQTKAMLRNFVQQIKNLNISIIVTHQVYAATQQQILKGEGVWIINDAVRYSLSQIALLTRLKLKNTDKVVEGIRMKCQGFKTRFAKPFQEVSIDVPYDTGMDPISGLLDVALQLGVVTQGGAWCYIDGTDVKFYKKDFSEDHAEQILPLMQDKIDFLELGDVEEDVGESEKDHKNRRKDATRMKQGADELLEG